MKVTIEENGQVVYRADMDRGYSSGGNVQYIAGTSGWGTEITIPGEGKATVLARVTLAKSAPVDILTLKAEVGALEKELVKLATPDQLIAVHSLLAAKRTELERAIALLRGK